MSPRSDHSPNFIARTLIKHWSEERGLVNGKETSYVASTMYGIDCEHLVIQTQESRWRLQD